MSVRPAFVFDPDRCTSCEACRVACAVENNAGRDLGWRTITTFNPSRHPALPTRHLSLACNHCETPACAIGCPANAYTRDANGAVLLDPAKCIGCRYCSWVCPYDAPKYDARESVMQKCTFCTPRLTAGEQPACTAACPTGALAFGAAEPPVQESSFHGLGATGLGPSLRVIPPRNDAPPPAGAIDELAGLIPPPTVAPRKLTARSEWALLVFSLVMPLLVGWFVAAVVDEQRSPAALPFLALGAAAMTLSAAHLGKPLRAWRAVLNVRRSWLSREIISANAFLLFGTLYLMLPHAERLLALPALIAGAALCVSIDAVYRAIPRVSPRRMHSAEAVLTAALWVGVIGSMPWVTWGAALTKAVLFGWRREAADLRVVGALRLFMLAGACVMGLPLQLRAAFALTGELIDRAAFYDELEPSTPALRMADETRARLGLTRGSDGRTGVRPEVRTGVRPEVRTGVRTF